MLFRMYLSIHVFLGLGGFQVTPWFLYLGQACWSSHLGAGIKEGGSTLLPGESLVEPWAPLQGGRVWDRYPLVTRATPSWPAPILGLEDVWVWVSLHTENVKPLRTLCNFFQDLGLEIFKVDGCFWMDGCRQRVDK